MIYLTSTGFSFVPSLASRVISDYSTSLPVAIVTNAAEGKERNKYAELAWQQLTKLGYRQVHFIDLLNKADIPQLKTAGLIYVCGGNTFQLLDDLVQSNLVEWLKETILHGTGYLGVSAGSIILGPSIKTASIGDDGDKDIVGLSDLSALGILDQDISPHYNASEEAEIQQYEEAEGRPVLRLTDTQAFTFDPQTKKLKEIKTE